jgi:hypothetical protein
MVQCEFDWVGIPDGDWLNGRAWTLSQLLPLFNRKSNVVKYFVRRRRMDTSVGKMFQCTLACTELSVGVSYQQYRSSILLPDYRTIEVKWLPSLKTFLSTMKAGVSLDEPSVAHLQRHGDSYIMNHILEAGIFIEADIYYF